MKRANNKIDESWIWDNQLAKFREPKNYHREWEKDGCVCCPSCDEIKSKEDDGHSLIYCDNCGYDF